MEEQLDHSRNITIGDSLRNSNIDPNEVLRRKAANGKTYKERGRAVKLLKEIEDPMAWQLGAKLSEDRKNNRKTKRINKFWE